MNSLFEKLGYNFKNVQYIETALTHSSYANEMKKNRECNERLEFLGDSVLSIVVADYLFKNCSHLPEGDMTKLR
ncbi:MAG: ribonuclease III, partial [Oscillospiraceae bacterium]|nr:ribonuclease III [Oscillospiraceae bacterium]